MLFAGGVPDAAHWVIVIEENHAASQIYGHAPYIDSLAANGAKLTDMHGITHPSQPNYFALFSGSTQGVTSNDPVSLGDRPNLADELHKAGKTFRGYVESPVVRKHAPWESFSNSAADERSFSTFPTDFNQLPDVAFVVPNQANDMHDGSIATGDAWIKNNLGAYATWAKTHNSVFVVTFDEDDGSSGNQIATVLYGQQVKTGSYGGTRDLYGLLRTVEDGENVPALNNAASRSPFNDIWTTSVVTAPKVTAWQFMEGGTSNVKALITEGLTLRPPTGASRGIRVQTSGAFGSIRFTLSGAQNLTTVESFASFDLLHTSSNGGSNGQVWKLGSYTLTAQFYSGANGSGTLLSTSTIHFAVG